MLRSFMPDTISKMRQIEACPENLAGLAGGSYLLHLEERLGLELLAGWLNREVPTSNVALSDPHQNQRRWTRSTYPLAIFKAET